MESPHVAGARYCRARRRRSPVPRAPWGVRHTADGIVLVVAGTDGPLTFTAVFERSAGAARTPADPPGTKGIAAMAEQDLTALAAAAAGGDRDALTRLIQGTQRDLTRFLTPLASHGDVEDLVQETYLRAVRALPAYAGRSSVRTWLFSIGRRVAADAVRLATRRPRIAALPDWQVAAEAQSPTTRFEDRHALADLLAGLAPERREAFVATQVAGLSYGEAAEVCGCPVGTIRSRVARAREDLVAAMRERDGHVMGA